MMHKIPTVIVLLFLSVVVLTVFLFYKMNKNNKKILLFLFLWGVLHSVLAVNKFYIVTETATFNPFVFILIPSFSIIFYVAFSKRGKQFYQSRNVFISPVVHVVRIPVELFLHYFALQGLLPKEMTFEGRNFDIVIGISAILILIAFYFFKLPKQLLLLWNYIGLFFVLFILVNGILASPITYKYFHFSQPNEAILYFPFILLPAIIVPIVIYTHLTDIILLTKTN